MKPVLFGTAMGMMLPFMLHGQGALGAALFVALHLALAALVFSLAALVPAVRKRISGHRPSPAHMLRMGGGLVAGWLVICIACPLVFGMAHPWA